MTTTHRIYDTKRTRDHNLQCATDGQRSYRVTDAQPLYANLRYVPAPIPGAVAPVAPKRRAK